MAGKPDARELLAGVACLLPFLTSPSCACQCHTKERYYFSRAAFYYYRYLLLPSMDKIDQRLLLETTNE
jgi:hypothetical protein